jgi:subtilisin family serine protease
MSAADKHFVVHAPVCPILEESQGTRGIQVRKEYLGCATAALALSLCACGGSGTPEVASIPPPPSTTPTIPPPVTTPTTEDFNTPEYQGSTSAKESNAMPAWQAGATGKGIKIGIVDSGISVNNPEFTGRIDPASRNVAGGGSLADQTGHGTALASIAAAAHGSPGEAYLEGVAFDATLVVMKVTASGCSSNCSYSWNAIADGINAAANAGAKVINLSIGGEGMSSNVADAIRRAAGMGVIFVVSAGNDGTANPDPFAENVVVNAPGQAIIVGALGQSPLSGINVMTGQGIDYNELIDFSDRAGSYRDWYLGAPGFVRADVTDTLMDNLRGTSFAAPAVAGAAALLLQAFPNLSPQEIVRILLTTANDLGAPGADATYGYGRLNIGRAFQPIGETALAGTGVKASLADNGSAPAAAGDAFERGTLRAIVLDAYQRAFAINLARTLRGGTTGRPLESAMASNVRSSAFSLGPTAVQLSMSEESVGRALGFTARGVGPDDGRAKLLDLSMIGQLSRGTSAGVSFSSGSRSLVRRLNGDGPKGFLVNQDVLSTAGFVSRQGKSFALRQVVGPLAINASRESGKLPEANVGDLSARYRLTMLGIDRTFGPATVFMSVSRLSENKTVLGGRLGPVFSSVGSSTLFADGHLSAALGDSWSLSASARRGWTKFASGRFTTGGYSLSLDKSGVWQRDDALTVLFSQPLRIDGGGLSLLLPGAYDYSTLSPTYNRTRMNLTPSGREITAEIGYARRLRTGSAGLNVYARRQPGHYASATPDFGAALQLKLRL